MALPVTNIVVGHVFWTDLVDDVVNFDHKLDRFWCQDILVFANI